MSPIIAIAVCVWAGVIMTVHQRSCRDLVAEKDQELKALHYRLDELLSDRPGRWDHAR